jgi:ElaB/YqjD/DUF883 family membrane-anchored ribosome-binding protein
MNMNFKVVYAIENGDSWEKDSIRIKSNIADDELITCRLSKSLVEHLKKESAVLEPDKLLLGFAEAQKREIEENLKGLTDIELNIKNLSDSIHQKLIESCDEHEKKYFELEKKFEETSKKINEKLSGTKQALDKDVEKVGKVYESLKKINEYGLGNLIQSVEKVLELAEKDKELAKLVLEHVR